MQPQQWATILFVIAATQIPVHFIAYVAYVRRATYFHSERGIFLYHFFSACLLTLMVVVGALFTPEPASFAVAIAIIAAHGIYSLTFLEFWTLSQISYSQEILLCARDGSLRNIDSVPRKLVEIGDKKRAGRLASLSRLDLVIRDGSGWVLTDKGRIASAVLRLLQWLPNMREAG